MTLDLDRSSSTLRYVGVVRLSNLYTTTTCLRAFRVANEGLRSSAAGEMECFATVLPNVLYLTQDGGNHPPRLSSLILTVQALHRQVDILLPLL